MEIPISQPVTRPDGIEVLDLRRRNRHIQNVRTTQASRYAMFARLNHGQVRAGFAYQRLADPVMAVIFKHFYDDEIIKPGKLRVFDLGLSLDRNFFSDYVIKDA